jgi:hypothetical protein
MIPLILLTDERAWTLRPPCPEQCFPCFPMLSPANHLRSTMQDEAPSTHASPTVFRHVGWNRRPSAVAYGSLASPPSSSPPHGSVVNLHSLTHSLTHSLNLSPFRIELHSDSFPTALGRLLETTTSGAACRIHRNHPHLIPVCPLPSQSPSPSRSEW